MAASSSSFILITLFSLVLLVTEARMAPGQYNNWQGVGKDKAMVEGLEHYMHHGESILISSRKKSDCQTSIDKQDEKAFLGVNLEWRPNQGDDAKLKGETSFVKDFEPRPNVSAYPEKKEKEEEEEEAGLKADKEFMKDFEPRPNVSAYPEKKKEKEEEEAGLKADKEFMKDFEPRPNVSGYQG